MLKHISPLLLLVFFAVLSCDVIRSLKTENQSIAVCDGENLVNQKIISTQDGQKLPPISADSLFRESYLK